MEKMNVDIEEIKQMQQKDYIGWSKYLLPYCREYFDAGYSIALIQSKLIELHELRVSITTFNRLLLQYRKHKLVSSKANNSDIITKGSLLNHSKNNEDAPGPRLSKLQLLKPQIKILLKKGVSVGTIAKVLNVSSFELKEFLKAKKLGKYHHSSSKK